MPAAAYPNLKQLDLPRCFVSVYHNFQIGRKLDISPSLFNNLYSSKTLEYSPLFPQFAEIVNNSDVLHKLVM